MLVWLAGCFVFVVGVQLPEPLTGKLWTLDDFEGNPALLVSDFFLYNLC